jgi:hypothetical protein
MRTDQLSVAARRANCSWNARSGVPNKRLRMPGGQPTVGQQRLDGGGSDSRRSVLVTAAAALPDAGGHLLVGDREVLDQLLIGGCFLQRREVLAVQVLHQRPLDRAQIVRGAHDRRDHRQAGATGRAPTPLPRDQLIHAPLPAGRTSTGCSTPISRTDAANSANDSSSKCTRG